MILVLLILWVFTTAAQVNPVKQTTITTGSLKFPVGTTTTGSFNLPAFTTGTLAVQIDCNPTLNLIAKIDESVDGGATWACDDGVPCRGFTRESSPCVDKDGLPITKIGATWSGAPFASVTKFRAIVTTNQAFTAMVTFTFDTTQ